MTTAAPLLTARLTEIAVFLDVEGTPIKGSLSAVTATGPDAAPAGGMGAFALSKRPEWTPEQMASIARDLARALHAAADDIAGQFGQPSAWGG